MGVDAYFMEYDTGRAGSFEPSCFLPKNKQIVQGVMTSKSGALESKEQLKCRVPSVILSEAKDLIAACHAMRSFASLRMT